MRRSSLNIYMLKIVIPHEGEGRGYCNQVGLAVCLPELKNRGQGIFSHKMGSTHGLVHLKVNLYQ